MQSSRFPSVVLVLLVLLFLAPLQTVAQDEDVHPLSAIPLRSIGPAVASGRVSDFAFHPSNPEIHYVAMASGGLWKTRNDGTTWTPVFDDEDSFALFDVLPFVFVYAIDDAVDGAGDVPEAHRHRFALDELLKFLGRDA